jgi:16S rRNA (uracil1498-N3)-methyltransferase
MTTFYHPPVRQGDLTLSKEESHHCIKVLRHQKGDEIRIYDGEGGIYQAVITSDHPSHCTFSISDKQQAPPDLYYFHLAIAPTKNTDRMEWMLEKCVEIGLHEITFIQCNHSERTRIRIDRLEKKMVSAMKQAGRTYATKINEVVDFGEFISSSLQEDSKYIAWVPVASHGAHLKEAVSGKRYVVLVGPEGDFSENEVQEAQANGFLPVSLGSNTLRSETAGLVACHTIALLHQ